MDEQTVALTVISDAMTLISLCGREIGAFSKVVATFNYVGRSFNLFIATTWDVWIIPFFSNLGLCATCWAHFMCHHELWPTLVGHPFSTLISSLGLAGGKHYQKITISTNQHFSELVMTKYINAVGLRHIFVLRPHLGYCMLGHI